MSRTKQAVWFAKGFTARTRHVDFRPPVQCEKSQEKRQAFMEGWDWANSLFRHNLEPYTEAEADFQASRWWLKARQVA